MYPRLPFPSTMTPPITSGPFQFPRPPGETQSPCETVWGRAPASTKLSLATQGAEIPASSAGSCRAPTLEPDVAASCSAPSPSGRAGPEGSPQNPEWISGRYARGWGGVCNPAGGVTGSFHAKTRTAGVSVVWGEGNVKFSCPPPELGTRIFIPIQSGRRGLQDPRVSGAGGQRSWGPGLLGPGPWPRGVQHSPSPWAWLLSSLPSLFGSCSRSGRTLGGAERAGGPGSLAGGYKGVRKSRGGDSVGGWRPTGTAARDPRAAPTPPEQAPPWPDPADSPRPCSRGLCGCFGTRVPPGESC